MTIKRYRTAMLLATILVAVVLSYWPALRGPYVLDDEVNITRNESISITELNLASIMGSLSASDSSPLRRPIASLTFALNHYFAGAFEPATPFKVTNLVIHLINVVLVYWLAYHLVHTPALQIPARKAQGLDVLTGFFCAAIWGLHPINVSNVAYIVQRMNSLSALFVLAGLLAFVRGRTMYLQNPKTGFRLIYGGIIGGVFLGITAKENAALLPILALATELTLFRPFERPKPYSASLVAFYTLVLIVPAVAAVVYLLGHPDIILGPYAARPFTLFERMLTEVRVLWYYVRLIAVPDAGEFGLFHDDIPISTSLLDPPVTLIGILGLIAAIGLCVKVRRVPSVAFAIAFFSAGHLLESTIFGLEIAFEHRNYVPSVGIVFALSHGLARYIASPLSPQPAIKYILTAGLLATLGFVNYTVADSWKDIGTLVVHSVRSHPDSPRANDFAATVSLNNGDLTSAEYYAARTVALAPKEIGYRINLYMISTLIDETAGRHTELLDGCRRSSLDCPLTPPAVIANLLRKGAISAMTTGTLVNLRICLVNRVAGCERLALTAREWFAAACENQTTRPLARESLTYNAALVHAHTGDYTAALGYLRTAAGLAPDKLSYRVGEADFLIRLKRFDEAERVLQEIVHDDHYPVRAKTLNEPAIGKLLAFLQARRIAKKPEATGASTFVGAH